MADTNQRPRGGMTLDRYHSGRAFSRPDSHVGFDKPANPNALGQNQDFAGEAFLYLHTGDITHLSKLSEFDDADRILSQARSDVHYVPGEHTSCEAAMSCLEQPR